MKIKELKIEGMTCSHCVMAVKKELVKVVGLNIVDVQIGRARVEYDEAKVKPEDLEKAVRKAGYVLVE